MLSYPKPSQAKRFNELLQTELTYDLLCDINLFFKPKDRTNCHKFMQWCLAGKFKDKYRTRLKKLTKSI
ncbi:hypothetical protein [Helicobacter felis]|uniref:hypothetical protein n=1 Tax=Helicobacter felis TaxID=214 RepID=UPI000CF05B21|nr:hypothetical protein [Helicobacter felis]